MESANQAFANTFRMSGTALSSARKQRENNEARGLNNGLKLLIREIIFQDVTSDEKPDSMEIIGHRHDLFSIPAFIQIISKDYCATLCQYLVLPLWISRGTTPFTLI